jgi:hypothetical protein
MYLGCCAVHLRAGGGCEFQVLMVVADSQIRSPCIKASNGQQKSDGNCDDHFMSSEPILLSANKTDHL